MTIPEPSPTVADRPRVWRLFANALFIMALSVIPVGLAGWIAGPTVAKAVYVGAMLLLMSVRTLPMRAQLWCAVLVTAVAAAGTLIGRNLPLLIVALVVTCVLQGIFTRISRRAVAVLPAILVLYALLAPASATVPVTIGTAIGAAYIIAAAAVLRMKPHPSPLALRATIVHTVLLAVGSCALLLIGDAVGVTRSHWGVLAFCLVLVPGVVSWVVAGEYALGVVVGAFAAVGIGMVDQPWLTIVAAALGGLCTVAAALAERTLTAVVFLTATVILLNSTPAHSVGEVAAERAGLAIAAVGVAIVLGAALSRLEPTIDRLFPAGAAGKDSPP